ncbi:MAG: hypothetical protein N2508_09450, partial [Anaerolineae bacterium]|nr:hypothetical protein [Anaerolineae bacterium]
DVYKRQGIIPYMAMDASDEADCSDGKIPDGYSPTVVRAGEHLRLVPCGYTTLAYFTDAAGGLHMIIAGETNGVASS